MIGHIKSNTIADFTGTVTVFNSAGATVTANATDMVLPSDWNSIHNQLYTLTGNTSNASTASGTNVVFSGGQNISLVGSGSVIGIKGPDLTPYLTTAALSNHSHGNPTLALTNLSGTTASNSEGFTLSLSAGAGGGGSLNVSAGTTSGNVSALTFSNANGVSFGLDAGTITASHNGLTTAAQSNHSHGNPTLNLTNLSGTTASNSAGLTLSLSAAAQTVQPVAASGSNGSFAFSTLSFGNLNGLSFYTSNGSIVGSYTDAGGAGGSFSAGMSNLGNTAGTSGMVGNRLVFVGIGEIALSQATDTNGATLSIYEPTQYRSNYRNHSGIMGAQLTQVNGATCAFGYMNLEADYSFDWMANQRSVALGAVTVAANATLINTSFGVTQLDTYRNVLYTRGSGANSLSLFSISSSTYTLGWQATVSVGAQSTQFSATEAMSYNVSGAAQSTYSTQYSMSSASFSLSTGAKTAFTGLKHAISDFPGTLSAGEYWVAYGHSTAQTTNLAAGSSLTAGKVQMSYGAQSLTNAAVGSQFGASVGIPWNLPGAGVANVTATSAVALSQFSSFGSGANAYVVLGRLV